MEEFTCSSSTSDLCLLIQGQKGAGACFTASEFEQKLMESYFSKIFSSIILRCRKLSRHGMQVSGCGSKYLKYIYLISEICLLSEFAVNRFHMFNNPRGPPPPLPPTSPFPAPPPSPLHPRPLWSEYRVTKMHENMCTCDCRCNMFK